MQFFKFLDADGVSEHGDGGTWPLPHDGVPGEWMPRATMEIIPVPPEILDYYSPWDRKPVWYRGWSLFTGRLVARNPGTWAYLAEWRGRVEEEERQIVVEEARLLRRLDAWDDRARWRFAADCVEHVLHHFTRARPDSLWVSQAIGLLRRRAEGCSCEKELAAVVQALDGTERGPGWPAFHVGTAAWAAARAADSVTAVRDAAGYAADAARYGDSVVGLGRAAPGSDAARADAESAERQWQSARMLEYLRGKA